MHASSHPSTATQTCLTDNTASNSEDSDANMGHGLPLPYRKGFKITAMLHEPPEPFGQLYTAPADHKAETLEELSQLNGRSSLLSREARTQSDVRKCFAITSTIRTGLGRGAQIVVVDRSMVAKIYDLLYYSKFDEYGCRRDVVFDAYGDYSREAAAYGELQKSPEVAGVIPAFYGTWTMDVECYSVRPHGKKAKHTRRVPFILIERIRGECMHDVDADDLREPVRSMVLKKALLADALISKAGVNHRDISPRNIMIVGSNYDDPEVPISAVQAEIKVIDFNMAVVENHPRFTENQAGESKQQLLKAWPDKLPSPIKTYYGRMGDFASEGWCSDSHRGPEAWLWQNFHDDERFIPVIRNPSEPFERPVYQEPTQTRRGVGQSSGAAIGKETDFSGKDSEESKQKADL